MDWLASHFPEPIPAGVRDQLTAGVHAVTDEEMDIGERRGLAARWIARHSEPDVPSVSWIR